MKVTFGSSAMWRGIGSTRVYIGVCAGSRSVGRLRKKWTDTVKECLREEVWMTGKQEEWNRIGVNGGCF